MRRPTVSTEAFVEDPRTAFTIAGDVKIPMMFEATVRRSARAPLP
jgi:hypothetical protein